MAPTGIWSEGQVSLGIPLAAAAGSASRVSHLRDTETAVGEKTGQADKRFGGQGSSQIVVLHVRTEQM